MHESKLTGSVESCAIECCVKLTDETISVVAELSVMDGACKDGGSVSGLHDVDRFIGSTCSGSCWKFPDCVVTLLPNTC